MKITVFYDYICPFSFIGSRRIQRIGGEFGLEIDWKGYEIHPEYPAKGKERKRTIRTIRVMESLQNAIEDEDIKFQLPGLLPIHGFAWKRQSFQRLKEGLLNFTTYVMSPFFWRKGTSETCTSYSK